MKDGDNNLQRVIITCIVYHSKDLGIDETVILEWIMGTWVEGVWTGCVWLSIRTGGGLLCKRGNEPSVLWKAR